MRRKCNLTSTAKVLIRRGTKPGGSARQMAQVDPVVDK